MQTVSDIQLSRQCVICNYADSVWYATIQTVCVIYNYPDSVCDMELSRPDSVMICNYPDSVWYATIQTVCDM